MLLNANPKMTNSYNHEHGVLLKILICRQILHISDTHYANQVDFADGKNLFVKSLEMFFITTIMISIKRNLFLVFKGYYI